MKLLYLYIDNFPPFEKTEMHFASGYSFRRRGNTLCVNFKNVLPEDFFSPRSQLYVSALAGPNGAGKTSLIRILEAIKYPIKKMVFILAIEAKGDILIYYNLNGGRLIIEAKGCKIEDKHVINAYNEDDDPWMNCDALNTCFNLVYYSPYYTVSNNLFHNDERFVDISTTALVNAAAEEGVAGRRHIVAAFKADEFKRLVGFYDSKKEMFPDLQGLAIVPNLYATNDIASVFYKLVSDEKSRIEILEKKSGNPERQFTDKELDRLGNMLSFLMTTFEDGFMQMVQSLAAYVWNYRTYKDAKFKEDSFGAGLYECLMGMKDVSKTDDKKRRKHILYFLKKNDYNKVGPCKMPVGDLDYKKSENPLYEFFLFISKLKSKSGEDGISSLVLPWRKVRNNIESLSALYAHCCKIGNFMELRFDPPRSSGQCALHTFYARLLGHFAETRDIVAGYDGNDFSREFAKHLESGWIVVLDEVEVTLHPEWQRGLVADLLTEFNKYFKGFNVHFIFATHSPIILSDIPKGNIVFLDEGHKVVESNFGGENTFGASIFDLYRLAFNQSNGTTGEFATNKIKDALVKVAKVVAARVDSSGTPHEPDALDDDTKLVLSQIGDPIFRKYLDGLKTGGLI